MSASGSPAPEDNLNLFEETTWSFAALYNALHDDGPYETLATATVPAVAKVASAASVAAPESSAATTAAPSNDIEDAIDGDKDTAIKTSPGDGYKVNTDEVAVATAISAPTTSANSAPTMVSRGTQANMDEEEDDLEEAGFRIGPIVQTNGNPATMNTPRECFKNNYDYLWFCETGESVLIKFGYTERDNSFTSVREMKTAKKLLADASVVFANAFQGGWVEARQQEYRVEITKAFNPNTWMRLLPILRGGGALLPTSGAQYVDESLVGWLHTYQLADYFQMHKAKLAIKGTMVCIMDHHSARWRFSDQMANLSIPSVAQKITQEGCRRVRDVSEAAGIAHEMYPVRCPFSVESLVNWLFSACPLHLIVLCQNDLDDAVCRHLAVKYIQDQVSPH